MEEKIVCLICGKSLDEESTFRWEGKKFCEHCFNEYTTTCDCCDERITRASAYGEGNLYLCRNCYEYNYTHCEDCGALIHNDDAYYIDEDDIPYCSECYRRIKNRSIKCYSYKPETIFYGKGNLFYGVELEVDKGGEDDEKARVILDVANDTGEKVYCKHDGSIDNGFEIVSHAATL